MLTLSRHSGEVILIGDSIRLRVVRITPTKVEVAIEAPDELRILRGERMHQAAAGIPRRAHVQAG